MAGDDRNMEQMLHTRSRRNPRDTYRLGRVAVNAAAGADTDAGSDLARTVVHAQPLAAPTDDQDTHFYGFRGNVATIDERHGHRPRIHSPGHLTIVGRERPKVVPLHGRNGDAAAPSAPGDSPSAMALRGWLVQSLLLEAIMREDVGDAAAAERALDRALELAERDRVLLPFLVDPVPVLLERHAGRCTAHAELISEIFDLLGANHGASRLEGSESLREPLTDGELRVLRYLPTHLSKREIADELYVSVNTVKTHVKHLYAKLDVQTRRHAVERAREFGLLTRSSRKR
jgi:DNA-binding CsgD family transcriptional regulator